LVLGSVRETLRDFAPAGVMFLISLENDLIFQKRSVAFIEFRVQTVEPALSALLAVPSRDSLATNRPFNRTIFGDPLLQLVIFRDGPVA